MRELCANTIYKFVNRFSFGAQESLTLAVEKFSFFRYFSFKSIGCIENTPSARRVTRLAAHHNIKLTIEQKLAH